MSALPCAVTTDLNRHLAALDAADALDDAAEAKVEAWLDDSDKIAEVWDDELEADGQGLFGIDVAIAMTGHKDDRAIHAERLLALVESKVLAKLRELAPDAVEADRRCAEYDRGEYLAECAADRAAGY